MTTVEQHDADGRAVVCIKDDDDHTMFVRLKPTQRVIHVTSIISGDPPYRGEPPYRIDGEKGVLLDSNNVVVQVERRPTEKFWTRLAEFVEPLWQIQFLKTQEEVQSTYRRTVQQRTPVVVILDVAELLRCVSTGRAIGGLQLLIYTEETHEEYYTSEGRDMPELERAVAAPRLEITQAHTLGLTAIKTQLYPFQRAAVTTMCALEEEPFEHVSTRHDVYRIQAHSSGDVAYNDVRGWFYLPDDVPRVRMSTRGGFLADKMGMGKTLTMLTLCAERPVQPVPEIQRPRTTLVICPSHVVAQWARQAKQHTRLNVRTLTSLRDLRKLTYGQLVEQAVDILVVSFSTFQCNSLRGHIKTYVGCVREKINALRRDAGRWTPEMLHAAPAVPFAFNWGRVIIDEFHELGQPTYKVALEHIAGLHVAVPWFVSGSPLVNYRTIARYLIMTLMLPWPVEQLETCKIPVRFMDDAAYAVFGRRTVIDSGNYSGVQLPGIRERVVWIDLMANERAIYDSLSHHGTDELLRACTYPRLVSAAHDKLQSVDTIEEMRNIVVRHLQHSADLLARKLEVEEDRLTSMADNRLVHSAARQNAVEKLRNETRMARAAVNYALRSEASECPVCIEPMQHPCMLRDCGHCFCVACCGRVLETTKRCPLCRSVFCAETMIAVAPGGASEQRPSQDTRLRMRYGSKIAALIGLVTSTTEVKTLIFSQWDELLHAVGEVLAEFAPVLYCRGAAAEKECSMRRFTKSPKHNLLLLSTLHSGSGSDLSVATRVILLDTIDGAPEHAHGIERQAIARCHRIGQTQEVEVVRLVVRGTIEERMHRLRFAGSAASAV